MNQPNLLSVPKEVLQKCFFPVGSEPHCFDGQRAGNYYNLYEKSGTERRFLGMNRYHRFTLNEHLYKVADNQLLSLAESYQPKPFYSCISKDHVKFDALLIGSTIPEIVRYQASLQKLMGFDSYLSLFSIQSERTNNKILEADFRKFIDQEFSTHFVAMRVRNGYDIGKGTGLGFLIGTRLEEDLITLICLSYRSMRDGTSSNFSRLGQFIYHYYEMSNIEIEEEVLRAVIFAVYNVRVPISPEGSGPFFEHWRKENRRIDDILKKEKPVSLALVIDFICGSYLYVHKRSHYIGSWEELPPFYKPSDVYTSFLNQKKLFQDIKLKSRYFENALKNYNELTEYVSKHSPQPTASF